MGAAYLRYSFTRGTVREVAALIGMLGLDVGDSVVDVGCGPGRHCIELARSGIAAHGVDISSTFVDVARTGAIAAADAGELGGSATFERADAAARPDPATAPRWAAGGFDAAISLCQGAFGLGGPGPFDLDPFNLAHEHAVLRNMCRSVRPGGRIAVSAFSAYFQVQWLEDHDLFDAATGVNEERTQVRDSAGTPLDATLWTTCFTPRELALLAERAGLTVDDIHSVTPGAYGPAPPGLESPEFLLLATRPS